MTFSINNYSLGLNNDDHLINHFDDLSTKNQQELLTFLSYMENLKNSIYQYTQDSNNSDADNLFATYTDDVINIMTNNILATWPDNYQEQLSTITTFNQFFKNNDYKKLFYDQLKQTPIENIIKEDDEFKLNQGETYFKHLKTINKNKQYHHDKQQKLTVDLTDCNLFSGLYHTIWLNDNTLDGKDFEISTYHYLKEIATVYINYFKNYFPNSDWKLDYVTSPLRYNGETDHILLTWCNAPLDAKEKFNTFLNTINNDTFESNIIYDMYGGSEIIAEIAEY